MAKLVSVKINQISKPLYDIQVKDNNNFVANGIVIHNSEQYLSRESLCVLASVNMGKFSTLSEIYFKQLERIGISINRFLDNVNECELKYQTYATPHQKLAIEKLRRTGAGITNICAWLFKKNLVYGTKEGNEAVEEFLKYYNYWLYLGSEKTGEEKGSFGLFDAKKWKTAPFVSSTIKASEEIAERFKCTILTGNFARNITCSSVAPTGCGVGDIELQTSDGIKTYIQIFEENGINISELTDGKEKQWFDLKKELNVKDVDGNLQKVTRLYYNGCSEPIFNIKLSDGSSLKFTSEHKVLVESNIEGYGEWKKMIDLAVDDKIIKI